VGDITLKRFDEGFGEMPKDAATNDGTRNTRKNGQRRISHYSIGARYATSGAEHRGHEWANGRRYLYRTSRILLADSPLKSRIVSRTI
jgi:hypothetical protein